MDLCPDLDYRRTYIKAVAATSDRGAALGLAQELVLDCHDGLGADHLLTLEARYLEAVLTAEADDGLALAHLFEALHTDIGRVLGEGYWLANNVRQHVNAPESANIAGPLDPRSGPEPSAV
jgi:hypothetical protein